MPTSLEARLQQLPDWSSSLRTRRRVGYEALLASSRRSRVKVQFAWHSRTWATTPRDGVARQALGTAPGYLPARFMLSFGNSVHGDYEAAVEEFAGLFEAATPKQLADGPTCISVSWS